MRCNKNQPSNLGSSETIREAPQSIQLNDYIKLGKPKHIKYLDKSFLEWFIGFSEGDGSFVQSKRAFIINQKDPKLLFRIKKKLGFGSVFKTDDSNIWRFSVTGKSNCLRLYYLFNGNLALKKTISRFTNWSNQLLTEISINQTPITLTLNNGWLAGFFEAEGGLYARVRTKSKMKTGFQFQKKFYISQKEEKSVLEFISRLLESQSQVNTFKQNNQIYNRIEISSFHSHTLFLIYLEKFPLFGRKNVSLCVWRKLHGRQNLQEHLTLTGLQKMKQLCSRLTEQNRKLLE